jgi:hypothetical protein
MMGEPAQPFQVLVAVQVRHHETDLLSPRARDLGVVRAQLSIQDCAAGVTPS